MNFAEVLSELMQSNGTTNYRLSKSLGCSATSVANWLAGKDIKPIYLQRIADYFNVSVDYLMGAQKDNLSTQDSRLDEDNIKAAFWGGENDLSEEEIDELWQDAKDYIRWKTEQKKKKGK